jgi:hypothetical protein
MVAHVGTPDVRGRPARGNARRYGGAGWGLATCEPGFAGQEWVLAGRATDVGGPSGAESYECRPGVRSAPIWGWCPPSRPRAGPGRKGRSPRPGTATRGGCWSRSVGALAEQVPRPYPHARVHRLRAPCARYPEVTWPAPCPWCSGTPMSGVHARDSFRNCVPIRATGRTSGEPTAPTGSTDENPRASHARPVLVLAGHLVPRPALSGPRGWRRRPAVGDSPLVGFTGR